MMHSKQRDENDEVDKMKSAMMEATKELDDDNESEMGEFESNESEEKRPEMTDSEIVAFCNEEIARGIGGTAHGDDSSQDIALAYDYYFGRKPGISKIKARDAKSSRFVSLDVQDAVESVVAEIMPMFDTEQIAYYSPTGQDDEAKAKAETDAVNHVFFNECNGYMLLKTCLKDALINRNSTAKVYWDKSKKVTYEKYDNVQPLGLADILAPRSEGEEIDILEQEVKETSSATIDENGIATESSEVFEIKLKRTSIVERPVVESVAPEQVIVSGDHNSPELNDVRFVAHESIVTASYLIERGVDKDLIDKLEDYNTSTEEQARSRTAAEFDYFSADESVKNIRVYDISALIDVDRDGIAERRKIILSGSHLLYNEPMDSVQVVGGCTTAVAHKYKGISLFDKLKDIQDSKTPVMRSIIDGTQLSSNPRVGVLTDGSVNIDDFMQSQTGGSVRMTNPNGIFELPRGEVPQSSYDFLAKMDSIRRERGGAAIDTASTAQMLDNSSEGTVSRVMGSLELINAELAMTFAQTLIRGIFVQLHQTIKDNYKGEITSQVRGQWMSSIPSEWGERAAVTVSVGSSKSERQRQKMAMSEIVGYQNQLKQEGSVMFDESKRYSAIIRSISLSGIKNPESFFVDPESEQGKQANQAKQQAQEMQSQLEQEMQNKLTTAQEELAQAEKMKGLAALQSQEVKIENERLKNRISEMKTMLDAKAKSDDVAVKLEKIRTDEALKLTELEVAAQTDLSQQNEENKVDSQTD